MSEHDFLIESEAAGVLRQSPKTLANKRVTGDGPPFIKAGGRVLYSRADLLTWLSERRRTSTSARPAA